MAGSPWFHPEIANKDANGKDLGYPGPDGVTLYYRGFPVGSAADWEAIQHPTNHTTKEIG